MKLLLIDLSSIFWSRWHATAGQDISAAYQATYDRVVQLREGFDACVVCCDVGRSFRHDLFPEYKANRPAKDAAAIEQLRRVREQLEKNGYSVLSAEGFEADDVIATLAVKAPGKGYDTVIATTDKDLAQLVGPGTSVLSDRSGDEMDAAGVKAKFGVPPEKMRDFLALVGDSSDNIKGAPGIGPKTAVALLEQFGNLDDIYANVNSERMLDLLTDKQHVGLRDNKDAVLLGHKLVGLRYDVPLDFDAAVAKREPAAPEAKPDAAALDDDTSEKLAVLPALATVAAIQPEKPDQQQQEPALGAMVLDKNDPRWALRLEPNSTKAAWWFAETVYHSQLYRKFPNAAAIFAVIMRGRSMGIDAMTALDGFHVIEGKPCASSMLLVACVMNSGKAEYFELRETTPTTATWVTKRKGAKNEIAITFTIEDAQRIGVVRKGSPWEKYPGAMCRKQAGAELARAVYPDVCANVYSPEEFGVDVPDVGQRVA